MARTAQSTSRPSRPATLPDSLRATRISLAREFLEGLDAEWDLVPVTHRAQFDADLDELSEVCADLGISNIAQLIERRTKVLSTLTGVTNPSEYLTSTDANPLHRYRNTLITLAVAASPNYDPKPVLETTRATLKQRTAKSQRPLLDDEIVLLRTVAAVTETGQPANQRTAVYAQCDAGMLVAETTQARVGDLCGDPELPYAICAAGNRITAPRPLPLGAFHRRALAASIAIASTSGPQGLLSYRPNKNLPGSNAAAASANGIIGRLLRETGLAHPDTAPFSLTRWRIAHTLATGDLATAAEISGRSGLDTDRLADPDPDIEKITNRAKENFMLLPAVA